MLDNYEKLGEMAATIALYRLPRDRESLRADAGPASCMRRALIRGQDGRAHGSRRRAGRGRRSHRSGHGVKDGFPHIGHDNALGLTLQPL